MNTKILADDGRHYDVLPSERAISLGGREIDQERVLTGTGRGGSSRVIRELVDEGFDPKIIEEEVRKLKLRPLLPV